LIYLVQPGKILCPIITDDHACRRGFLHAAYYTRSSDCLCC
jgi:hypothetical protein